MEISSLFFYYKKKGGENTCTKPLIRVELNQPYRNKKGKISYKAKFMSREQYDKWCIEGMHIWDEAIRRIDPVPCGQCHECILQKSSDWANRCMLEKKYHKDEECWFITLTYDDVHIPFNMTVETNTGEIFEGISLKKTDMQNFWKKLRRRYPNLKYLQGSEYGSQTNRPHYHAIIFGVPLNPYKLKKYKNNYNGDPLWTHEELDELWGKGFVTIGRLTWETAAYVARYTMKNQYKTKGVPSKIFRLAQGQVPEYAAMSQRIGMQYFWDHWKEIYETDTIPVTHKGQLQKPPLAFDRKLKEIDEELYNCIKEKRKKQAEYNNLIQDKQTDLSREKRREQKELIETQKFKNLRIGV